MIVVIDPSKSVAAAARACAASLGNELQELRSVREAVALTARAEAFVFGPAMREPIQAVQHLYTKMPETPVIVVAEAAARDSISRALRFSPFVSSLVRCTGDEPDLIAQELDRAVRDHRRRRRYKKTIASLNEQMGGAAEGPPQLRATEYLGRLLEVAPVGVVTSDPAGSITACNAKAAALLETSERDALGKSVSDWFAELTADGWPALLEQARQGPVERIVRRHLSDGSVSHLQVMVAPVASAGEESAVLLVLLDVTTRHEAERQRDLVLSRERAARAEAEASSRAKDEFLSAVSHELRTPLSSIIGWTHMLRDGGDLPPEKRRHAIEVIHRNARAQAKLIEDLLDVSRIVSGKLRLSLTQMEPLEAIEMAIETVRPAAEAKGVRLQTILARDAGLILGDLDRLQQIAWNLLANAIKFTPRGGRVQVTLRRFESSIELAVADTGRGIAQEFLPHVFERFRQEDGAATRAQGGLGLGLAIARHLVELQGGTISVQSPGSGQGAVFTVRLPIAPLRLDERRTETQATSAAPAPAAPQSSLAGLHILLLDDEPDTRDMLTSFLESQRAVVFPAESVRDALAALAEARPDIVISDIGMPLEDGYSFIKQLRERPETARVPAIALTAYARTEDRTRALHAGFNMHVPKPVDVRELVAVIASLTRSSRPQ